MSSSPSLDEKTIAPALTEDVRTYSDGKVSASNRSTAPSSEVYVPTLSKAEQGRVWRKLDIYLLPFVSLLYLFSFLCVLFLEIYTFNRTDTDDATCSDRANIGIPTFSPKVNATGLTSI